LSSQGTEVVWFEGGWVVVLVVTFWAEKVNH